MCFSSCSDVIHFLLMKLCCCLVLLADVFSCDNVQVMLTLCSVVVLGSVVVYVHVNYVYNVSQTTGFCKPSGASTAIA